MQVADLKIKKAYRKDGFIYLIGDYKLFGYVVKDLTYKIREENGEMYLDEIFAEIGGKVHTSKVDSKKPIDVESKEIIYKYLNEKK